MKRCSWWVIGGFSLLVLGLVYFGLHYWYAGEYIPDDPVTKDSKNFLHSPRSDARIDALFGAGMVILLASAVSLIGIVKGSRTRGCLAMGLVGPLVLSLPFLRQFGHGLMMWLQAL